MELSGKDLLNVHKVLVLIPALEGRRGGVEKEEERWKGKPLGIVAHYL